MSNDNCRPCVEKDTSDAQLINCIQRSMAKFSWPRTGSSRCQERVAGYLIDQYGPMIADSATRVCRSVKGDGPVQASDVDAARQGARIGGATPFQGLRKRFEVGPRDCESDRELAGLGRLYRSNFRWLPGGGQFIGNKIEMSGRLSGKWVLVRAHWALAGAGQCSRSRRSGCLPAAP